MWKTRWNTSANWVARSVEPLVEEDRTDLSDLSDRTDRTDRTDLVNPTDYNFGASACAWAYRLTWTSFF